MNHSESAASKKSRPNTMMNSTNAVINSTEVSSSVGTWNPSGCALCYAHGIQRREVLEAKSERTLGKP